MKPSSRLRYPDARKISEPAANTSPFLKRTLSPAAGQRERERGPTLIPRPILIQVAESEVARPFGSVLLFLTLPLCLAVIALLPGCATKAVSL